MGLFFGGFDDRSIPGTRKSGFARYREVLEENWKDFIKVGFITLVFFIPLGAGLVYAVGTKSALLAILAGLAGGAISGLGYACMVDLILRRLRNDRDDWSVCWKRSMKQNALASLLPGALQGLLLALITFILVLIDWGAAPITIGTLVLMAVSILLATMVLTAWWPQVVTFEERALRQLRNAVLFCIFRFGKVFLSALVQVLWWAVIVLFLPWTAFVIPILGLWYILFVALHLIYPKLDEDFHIEEQIEEKFPGRLEE